MEFTLNEDFFHYFKNLVEEKKELEIKESLSEVNAADICSLLNEFDEDEAIYILSLLDHKHNADIIIELEEEYRKHLLNQFPSKLIASFLEHLESDDGADLLKELSLKQREEIISKIKDPVKANHLLDLLKYDEDVAGGLMGKEMVVAHIDWTVDRCIEEIRYQADKITKIYTIFVVDNDYKLLGRLSLKRLIISNGDTKVSEIYNDEIISVKTSMSDKGVAQIMQKYDLESLPVINAIGKLVGRITIDDVLDVVTESAEEERQLMAGVSGENDDSDTVWQLSKARLPWLMIGMGGGLFAAQITDFFYEDLKLITGLALFIPLIMATGGNVGIQASSTMIQSLANENVFRNKIFTNISKVMLVGLLNAFILGILVFIVISVFSKHNDLSIIVGISMINVVFCATFLGTVTPLILNKMGYNPALASGPFITTANDLIGISLYLLIAHVLHH